MKCFAKKQKKKQNWELSYSIMFILSPPVFYLEAADEAESLQHTEVNYQRVSPNRINKLNSFTEYNSHYSWILARQPR